MILVRIFCAATVTWLLLSNYAAGAEPQSTSTPSSSPTPSTSATTTFKPYIAKDKTFKILMPGLPQIHSMSFPETNVTYNKIYSVYSNDLTYSVAVSKVQNLNGSKPPKALLDDVQSRHELNNTLIKQKDIILQNKYPGREFEMTNNKYKDVVTRQRTYLVNDWVYQVGVSGASSKMVHSGAAEIFLNSLNVMQ